MRFGCFQGNGRHYLHLQAFSRRLLDVFCKLPVVTSSFLALRDGLWMFSGGWRTLRPLASIFSAAFGRFSLASWCYIHFLGFAGRDLDIFRGMADITSSGGIFAAAFGRFSLASWCCIHFLGFARRDLDVFRRMTDLTSTGRHFLGDFWTFFASFLMLHPHFWLHRAGFGCFQRTDGHYVHWQAFSLRLLDVSR